MAEKPHKSKSMKTRSRAEKVTNQPIAKARTYSALFEAFLSENRITIPIQEPKKISKKQEVL